MPDKVPVLTHHVNARHPRSGEIETFKPGEITHPWLVQQLEAEGHDALSYMSRDEASRLTAQWKDR